MVRAQDRLLLAESYKDYSKQLLLCIQAAVVGFASHPVKALGPVVGPVLAIGLLHLLTYLLTCNLSVLAAVCVLQV